MTSPETETASFLHVVYFWLKNPEQAADRTRFLENVKEYTRQIPQIRTLHIGTPAGTPREVVDNSYTFSLIVSFDSPADHDAYQAHEAHQAFVEKSAALWERVQVYDSVRV